MDRRKYIKGIWPCCVLLGVTFVLYLILNELTPLWCDDLDYADDGRTLRAILNRETHDYLYHSGRFFSHSLVQLFGGILGKSLFNVVNPLMTVALVYLVPLCGCRTSWQSDDRGKLFFLISLSLFLVWFILPDQYITMFMIAGSSNYIWASVLNLLFLYLFKRVVDEDMPIGGLGFALLLLLSFLSGTWMEMFSIAILPSIALYLLVKKKIRNRRALWMTVLYGIGTGIVVLAPGNFVRHSIAASGTSGFFTWVINQLEIIIRTGLFAVWLAIVVLLIIRCCGQDYTIKRFISESFVFLSAILISYAFVFVSGVPSSRVEWGIFIFSFVILFLLLQGFSWSGLLSWILSIIPIVMVLYGFGDEFGVFREKKRIVDEMVVNLKMNSLTDGDTYLWPKVRDTRKSIPAPSGENGNWPGEYVAKYYQVSPFKIIPREAYQYCKGFRNADSLLFGVFPCLGSDVLIRLDKNNDFGISVRQQYRAEGFVFRSSLSRLLRACGGEGLSRRVYNAPNPFPGGKLLLERMSNEPKEIRISRDSKQYSVFSYAGEWFAVVPQKDILPFYDTSDIVCTVE